MKKVNFLMALFSSLTLSIPLSFLMCMLSGHFSIPSWLMGCTICFVFSFILSLLIPMQKLQLKICKARGSRFSDISSQAINALISTLILTPIVSFVISFIMVNMANKQMDKAVEGLEMQMQPLNQQLVQAIEERNITFEKLNNIKTQVDEYIAEHKGPDEYVDTSYHNEKGEYVEQYEWVEDNAYTQEEEYQTLAAQLESARVNENVAENKCEELQEEIKAIKTQKDGINNNRPTVLKETLFCLTVTSILGFFINFIIIPIYFEKLFEKYGGDARKVDGVLV